ncbi:hypothetical protein KS4_15200 [Poriferisphaera corsica]|uniref:ASCH domain-containing protein n=1 Tax=Poriferisphaera corsica TaxID=2528020 RepID=A0A517YTH6_9BACT|nr:hypothetical protein [Poriferisphaera corsica]QDU33472.1 hypothetical protein KS4_15200 [Poriferisphaera corsica]
MCQSLPLFSETPSVNRITPDDCIVLSLHPNAWQMVLSGQKSYEFRRRFRRHPTLAFIYVTVPVKAIAGAILLDNSIEGTAKQIADIADAAIPGNYQSVYDYFITKNHGLAIPIRHVCQIRTPLSLEYLRQTYQFTAPQFYLTLKNRIDLLNELLHAANISINKLMLD